TTLSETRAGFPAALPARSRFEARARPLASASRLDAWLDLLIFSRLPSACCASWRVVARRNRAASARAVAVESRRRSSGGAGHAGSGRQPPRGRFARHARRPDRLRWVALAARTRARDDAAHPP